MDDDYVSASELARLGYCERQVAFDAAYGRRTTARQRQGSARGIRAHDEFLQESRRIAQVSERKGRCLIATLALGECSETRALRQYRDLFLRQTGWGRQFVALYYRVSPVLCRWLEARPALLSACRPVIRLMAIAAQAWVNRRIDSTGVDDEQ